MKKSGIRFFFIFILLLTIGMAALIQFQPDVKKEVRDPEKKEVNQNALLPFSGKLKRDSYEEHLEATRLQGLGRIADDYQLFLKIADRTLVEIDSGKGYQVDTLTHSFAFLTTKAKDVLEQLGQAYQLLEGEGSFFTISSLTRTEKQQKALKRRNRNAVDSNSSHSYGISFDISYIRFNGVRSWDHRAQKNLETVLNHFQQTGRIYVIKERGQSCYHVTVR
jgi:hypothetical protein